ncbi:HNH endonuclease [Maioricimonas sp. JC845]|uniref:HNH endonuclease n=1 Tax=Maioricimonas sp. JC845 TaxID=3232138 RepID=UPI003459E7A9
MARGRVWVGDEHRAIFRLYCSTPFGRLHSGNPEIIEIAERIGRTPSAVAMKACNFASLDPAFLRTGRSGLGNASNADKVLLQEFLADSARIAEEVEAAYQRVMQRNDDTSDVEPEVFPPDGPTEVERLVKTRRVQQFFRNAVLATYSNRCALTGISRSELLVASHIIPWSQNHARRADPRNGLCLNSLHDRAFDQGLLTFDSDYRVIVSEELLDQKSLSNEAKAFLAVEGQQLELPERFRPDPDALAYHRAEIFRGTV